MQKYIEILKNKISKEINKIQQEIELSRKNARAKEQSLKTSADLRTELLDKEQALDTALQQDTLNFRSLLEIKKEIIAKRQDIEAADLLHKELFD